MVGSDPDRLRCFGWLNVEINHDGFLVAAHEDADERLLWVGVDFLMRRVGRHVDEIAGLGFGDILELIAPAHAGASAEHIDDAFERAVVMGAGFGIGLDVDRARPEFLGAGFGVVDGGGAGHAWGLGGVAVKFAAADDADAVIAPVGGLGHGAGSFPCGEILPPSTPSTPRTTRTPRGCDMLGMLWSGVD